MARRAGKRGKKTSPEEEAQSRRPSKSGGTDAAGSGGVSGQPAIAMSRRKQWAFRIIAAVGVPLLLFVVAEAVLRLAGAGYPTGFYLNETQGQRRLLIDNHDFGVRFFGRQLARAPAAIRIAAPKPAGTVRIIVFGESAAFGDPQPEYGLPRMLWALLSLRHPDRSFEVVNAAMTAINSHVIREIARDNVRAEGDIWVVYMGNNEVVGPFGAGTVFGPQVPPLAAIRATLAVKNSRVGQALDRLIAAVRQSAHSEATWGGMRMFLEQRVRRDDPRMNSVYDHFAQNLSDIVTLGRGSGAGVVVSTVAVNLLDCAPFASDPSDALSDELRREWEALVRAGDKLYESADFAGATAQFEQAAVIDSEAADLAFRRGRGLAALGKTEEARAQLQLACDLDLLRFRCDSRLNEIIRQDSTSRSDERVRFVDAERQFHSRSNAGISGRDFFYEHVHLTFEGAYLLARLVAEQIEPLLPASEGDATTDWPTAEDCATRLAWAPWAHFLALDDVLARIADPPFTDQLNHDEQVTRIKGQLTALKHGAELRSLLAAAQLCRQALRAAPNDFLLNSQLTLLLANAGDLDGAREAAQHGAELMPHHGEPWHQLGLVLAKLGQDREAEDAFRKALARDPRRVEVRHELAKTLLRLDRSEEGIAALRALLKINSHYGPAYYTLGAELDEAGQRNEADEQYRRAIGNLPEKTDDLARLAQTCQARGWHDDALNIYRKAIGQSADDPALYLGAATSLLQLGKSDEAEREFAKVLELAPGQAEPRVIWGNYLARRGQYSEAAEHYAAALRLDSASNDARIGLGVSLVALGRSEDALKQFQEVLKRDPTNAVARNYATRLQSPPAK
jgi:tetratricopeptide (TPR) repeat protein